jgi:hypothetical protein
VRVGSPYLAECVSGGTPAANDRVKKVVRHWTGHKIVLFWEIWVEKKMICSCMPLCSSSSRGRGCKLVVQVGEDFTSHPATAWEAPCGMDYYGYLPDCGTAISGKSIIP